MNKEADDLLQKNERDIIKLTGLTKEQLDKMDIGDVERHFGIKATDPNKKRIIYKFVSDERRKKIHDRVTKILEDFSNE